MRPILTILLLSVLLNPLKGKIIQKDSIPSGFLKHPKFPFLKKDTFPIFITCISIINSKQTHSGIFWHVESNKISLLPKGQYLKWKYIGLPPTEFTFTEIPASHLMHMKIYRDKRKLRSVLLGAGIGIAMGVGIGILRKNAIEGDECSGRGTFKCLGEDHQIRFSTLVLGTLGTLTGLVVGSLKLHIRLEDGMQSYEKQREKIRQFSVLSR